MPSVCRTVTAVLFAAVAVFFGLVASGSPLVPKAQLTLGLSVLAKVKSFLPVEVRKLITKTFSVREADWENIWKSTDTPFWHLPEPNSILAHIAKEEVRGSVFVPLCGASHDLRWFAQQPDVTKVTGVDVAVRAVELFFTQRNITFVVETFDLATGGRGPREADRTWSKRDGKATVFTAVSSPDPLLYNQDGSIKKIQIFHHDLFDPALLAHFMENKFDLIYDRASLIAIMPEHRGNYSHVMKNSLSSSGAYYVQGMEYLEFSRSMPPRIIRDTELQELYEDAATSFTLIPEARVDWGDMFSDKLSMGVKCFQDFWRLTFS